MALATALTSLSIPSLLSLPSTSTPTTAAFPSHGHRQRRLRLRLVVAMADLLGDLGARDPFPEEIASNFGENVLGHTDTFHRILIPSLSALSLARLPCQPVSSSQPSIAASDAQKLLKKVVGWRLEEVDGALRLQCFWKVRDEACGQELIRRITNAVEGAGHSPNLLLEPPNQVKAELWTASIGGLSMNDFIIAARVDQVKTVDLVPKKRVWA